jgi:23S rRNA (cytidine1920-2'-O)/16S rRNA (cytidine1409-2'-O)-methyltransferase
MRLDQSLVSKQGISSRSQANDIIKRGYVFVNHIQILKPAYQVLETDFITIDKSHVYVSRGGDKLYPFITSIQVDIRDKIALDVGASTGGFSDVLLSLGAKHIFCVDVGKQQLAEHLKQDSRITNVEEMNILNYDIPNHDVCVIDVSFTSVLPILNVLYPHAKQVIVLIKPQFEQQKKFKDVIKNEKERETILEDVIKKIKNIGYHIHTYAKSHVLGKKGNQEYFAYLTKD